MGITTLTAAEVAEYTNQKLRLEPLAKLVGLPYDDTDRALMHALFTIESRLSGNGSHGNSASSQTHDAQPGSLLAQARAQRLAWDKQCAESKADDVGVQVLDRMRARRGLPPVGEGQR